MNVKIAKKAHLFIEERGNNDDNLTIFSITSFLFFRFNQMQNVNKLLWIPTRREGKIERGNMQRQTTRQTS